MTLSPPRKSMAKRATAPSGGELARLDLFRADLRDRAFAPSKPGAPPRVGVEIEWIPILADTGLPCPVSAADGPSLLGMLRAAGEREGWQESVSSGGVASFMLPSGGVISFEPGGQVEYSTPPRLAIEPLLLEIEGVSDTLARAAADAGIRLLTRGIDPENSVDRTGLWLSTERYSRMAGHFDASGPAGRRMMRQTAAFHINLDWGKESALQWRVANDLAPYLVAIFANSSRYEGCPTGHRNYRAHQWRELEPHGLALPGEGTGDRVDDYLEYALDSPSILSGREDEAATPFREWAAECDLDGWHRHLTTLFPDVRPRGYLEIRSVDALPARWYAAPIVFLSGILFDREALDAAALELPPLTRAELIEAGRKGVSEPVRKERALRLFSIALEGAARLGDFMDAAALATAASFVEEYTARGLDPGGDPRGAFPGA